MVRCIHYLPRLWLEDGGVARAVLDFCRIFAQLGHPTTLLTGGPAEVPDAWRRGDDPNLPKVIELDAPRGPLQLLPGRMRARVETALGQADVLHLHAPWTPSNLQLSSWAHRLHVPYVLSLHGMLDDWSMNQSSLKKRAYLALRGHRMLRRAARVHCTAQAELEQARKRLPGDNAVVLPLVMDLSAYEQLPGPELARGKFASLGGGEVKLLFLSRVHPKKGVDPLIRAVGRLCAQGIATRLIVAGPGDARYLEQLRGLARELKLEERVEFVGMVRGTEKLSLYQAADLFVLPTSQENFGLVLLEAMACGLPVVTTRGVDIWRELAEGGAAIADPDANSLAEAISRLLTERKLVERGALGRQWVMTRYYPQRVAGEYGALYERVMEEGRGGRAGG